MALAAHSTVAQDGTLRVTDYRASIKSAIQNELHRLHRDSGGYCQFVGRHEREFTGGELADIYVRLLGQSPGILIRLGDSAETAQTLARTRYRAEVELEIALYSGHMGPREQRIGGDSVSVDGVSDPGIDRMAADVIGILIGRELLAGAYPITRFNRSTQIDADEGTVELLRCILHADVYPAHLPPEGDRPFVDSIQVDTTIPTAEPPSATKVSTLSTEDDA